MSKSVAQAEAELRTAALDHAEAYAAYSAAFERNHEGGHYDAAGVRTKPLHPETDRLVSVSTEKRMALHDAAMALRDTVRAELRAEAL